MLAGLQTLLYYREVALHIKHPEADRLARELAAWTGERVTEAVMLALRERLEGMKRRTPAGLSQRLLQIDRECANLPEHDPRSAEQTFDYGPHGLPL